MFFLRLQAAQDSGSVARNQAVQLGFIVQNNVLPIDHQLSTQAKKNTSGLKALILMITLNLY